MKTRELGMLFVTVAVTLGLAGMVGRWQTKSLREDVASLSTKCQFLEEKVKSVTEQAHQAKIRVANAEAAIAEGQVAMKTLDATRLKLTGEPRRYTWNLLHTVKRGFNDIQHHVAAGRFPGLALTDGYVEMNRVLNNPAFEEMLATDHGLTGR